MNYRTENTTWDGLGIVTFVVAMIGFLTLLVVGPRAVLAQDVDSRLLPWVGCWQVVDDINSGDVVCVRPGDAEGSVVLDHSRDGATDVVLHPGGGDRAVSQAGCEGVERSNFSPDGRRIYSSAELSCDGGAAQTSTGLVAMVAEDEWISIRSLEMDGERVAWVQRYVQATPAAVEAAEEEDPVSADVVLARRMASRAPTLETLAEVARAVDTEVAAAWIVESGYPFRLNGETLLALADAGVDPEVIDVAVAVSNPDHFSIGAAGDPMRDRAARERGYVSALGYSPYFGSRRGPWGYFSPWGYTYDPFFFGSGGYLYNGGYYGYNRYGYGYPTYGIGYGYRPTTVVVTRRGNEGGRAVAGRGYSRGRSSSAPSGRSYTPPRSGGSSGSARPSSGSSGGTRTAKPRGGGGGGASSAAARSSGSGSRSTTSGARRTAKPRGGGGGFYF